MICLTSEDTPMAIHHDHRGLWAQSEELASGDRSSDFVLIQEVRPPPRIELARERMLMCRLYLGLIQSVNDDYAFAGRSDSATLRTMAFTYFSALSCARPLARVRSRTL